MYFVSKPDKIINIYCLEWAGKGTFLGREAAAAGCVWSDVYQTPTLKYVDAIDWMTLSIYAVSLEPEHGSEFCLDV